MENGKFLSTKELAKMLGVSRVTIFKKIRSGEIKTNKVGRNFIILREDLPTILGITVGKKQKEDIDLAVKKAVKQYGETLRLLGKE